AEAGHDLVLSVEKSHSRFQLRDEHQLSARVKVAGVAQSGNKSDVLTVQSKRLQPVIAPVRDGQDRLGAAHIHPDAVRLIELSRLAAHASERPDVAGFAVVLVYVA